MVITLAKKNRTDLHLQVKPNAIEAWNILCYETTKHKDYPCLDKPYFYTDYDGLGFPEINGDTPKQLTADQGEELCAGCPILKQCYDFAVANDEQHGLWGGIVFDKRLDENMLDE